MRPLLPLLLLAALASNSPAAPWDNLRDRSISRSHQFVVYAEDPNARSAIAMDAEDVKDRFLKLIDSEDRWKRPIVIQLVTLQAADPLHPPSEVRIVNTEEGFKVELDITLGDDPRNAHFPQQLVRAMLLDTLIATSPRSSRPA